jgi:cellulose synthase/poly-beta-1,6-N-acetylglucosamine synthase-like glycosyltransferase
MRDTIIRNALKTVSAPYVVTLDADSVTDNHMSVLIGELEHRQLDIASIRIIPSNGEKSLLAKLQVFEYETAMDFRYLCPWLISGACHCAKTYVLKSIMDRHSLFFQGNDVEIGLLAKTMGYRVGHIPFIVRTAVPEDLNSWIRQRLAWAGGEFRLYIINLKFITRHPFFWFYGAVITIGLFPLRWVALSVSTPSLYVILGLYIVLTIYVHWKNRNKYLFLMPFYTLFISVVMAPLGVIWYFYMARKDKNYGIINKKQ